MHQGSGHIQSDTFVPKWKHCFVPRVARNSWLKFLSLCFSRQHICGKCFLVLHSSDHPINQTPFVLKGP